MVGMWRPLGWCLVRMQLSMASLMSWMRPSGEFRYIHVLTCIGMPEHRAVDKMISHKWDSLAKLMVYEVNQVLIHVHVCTYIVCADVM